MALSMRPRAYIGPKEDEVTAAVVEYCSLRGVPVAHVPNEGKRSPQQGAKLKRMGLSPGFPDLVIPLPRGNYHGLYIELKVGNNKTTSDQKRWLTKLSENGYAATACWGTDEAVNTINAYLRGGVIPLKMTKA
jgi:hypothetical protein